MGFDEYIKKVPKIKTLKKLIPWDDYDWFKTFDKESKELAYFRKDYPLNYFIRKKLQYNIKYDDYIAVFLDKNDLKEIIEFLENELEELKNDQEEFLKRKLTIEVFSKILQIDLIKYSVYYCAL